MWAVKVVRRPEAVNETMANWLGHYVAWRVRRTKVGVKFSRSVGRGWVESTEERSGLGGRAPRIIDEGGLRDK